MKRVWNNMLCMGILLLCICMSGCGADAEADTRQEETTSESDISDVERPGNGEAADLNKEETGSGEADLQIPEGADVPAPEESPSPEELLQEQAEEILASMTLEEKVAQLFFVTPEAITGYTTVTAAGDATKAALDKYPVGGLIYFSNNLVSPKQTKEMLGNVQKYALQAQSLPLFLGVDEEGGRVLRIGNNSAFGVERIAAMGELAKSQDADVIYDAGDTIGAYLAELGFNVDFAPDADVLVNAGNQVIGDRSFGEDPVTVADMAWAFSEGLHDNHVLATYKHFPGHGGTAEDSHSGYAYLYKTLEELRQSELIPFQDGSEKGIDFIMVSHISDEEVTGDNTPASLSGIFVTDILRDELGYQGIIITDALNMGAITKHYGAGETAVRALQAGCDMILMPQDFKTAYNAVLEAVWDQRISEERLDESVKRIILTKLRWMPES